MARGTMAVIRRRPKAAIEAVTCDTAGLGGLGQSDDLEALWAGLPPVCHELVCQTTTPSDESVARDCLCMWGVRSSAVWF